MVSKESVMRRRQLQSQLAGLVIVLLVSAISDFASAQGSAAGQPAPAEVPVDRFEAARTFIRTEMERTGIPSVAVAVAKDGKILWEEGFGWADRENMVAATPNTMYSLASISKPMTATALMKLVEQSKVNLDRPANDYLGTGKVTGPAGDTSQATIRRVLSHTAGLPLHFQFFYEDGGYRPPSMDETIARYGILVHPPGKVYEYSNLGFGILGEVIARVTHREYADYMRTEVFLPLAMTRTSVGLEPRLKPHAAVRYDAQQRPIPTYDFDHPAASIIYSSAHDLIRFGMFHLKDHLPEQQQILKDTTLDLMHTLATPTSPTEEGYGLGWFIDNDDNGYRRVFHTGRMPGVRTILNLYPSENVAIVVLTNRSNPSVLGIAQQLAASVLPKYAEALAKKKPREEPKPPPFVPPSALLGEWSGTVRTWEDVLPFHLTFQPDGDVHVKMGEQLETLLNNARFKDGNLQGRFLGAIPTKDASRHRHAVLLNLWLRDGKLSGEATAQTVGEPAYFALTSYAELSKNTP
jgi:CubicO group peptidase (beta-lactamase class C family)